MKHRRAEVLIVAVAASFALACDPAANISFDNPTNETLTVFPQGLSVPSTARTLPPRGRYVEGMLMDRAKQAPDAKIFQFAATGPDGEVVFCRQYSYDDLRRDQFVIVLRPGTRECGTTKIFEASGMTRCDTISATNDESGPSCAPLTRERLASHVRFTRG